MEHVELYSGDHKWICFGRDPLKPEKIIDTNQYMVKNGNRVLLLDPGGIEIFSSMLAHVLHHAKPEEILDIFSSHQDPDVISSLGLWDKALSHATLHAPSIWEGFIRHFGCESIEYAAIPDKGKVIELNGLSLECIPAHYLHASGNFHLYDRKAKILMSGDVGAALDEPGAPMFVEDFESHIPRMEYFHRRWMPSNSAKNDWVQRVRQLDVDILAPQHGRLFKGDDVKRFLDWFESIEVGFEAKGKHFDY